MCDKVQVRRAGLSLALVQPCDHIPPLHHKTQAELGTNVMLYYDIYIRKSGAVLNKRHGWDESPIAKKYPRDRQKVYTLLTVSLKKTHGCHRAPFLTDAHPTVDAKWT